MAFNLSIESLSVDLVIVPAFTVFLLILLPVPFVSRLVTNLVVKIESVQGFRGISVLFLSTALSFACFAFALYKYTYALPLLKDKDPSMHHHEWENKRLKGERNMYLHCLAFVLVAALLKISHLNKVISRASKAAKDKAE